jgi:diguanylate cyclase (GGDEF)-like protein
VRLVGDTPLDVVAARECGGRAVAVATGPYGQAELAAAGADVVLADLRDTDAVLQRCWFGERSFNLRGHSTDLAPMDGTERPRSLGHVIRTLFAKRPDPYYGNDIDNARRLGGMMWLIFGTVAALVLPFAPPSVRYALPAWIVAVSLVASVLLIGRHWLRRRVSFNALLAGSYLALAQLAGLQALTGSGAAAYQELYLLLAVYTAAVHPPRRTAPYLAALSIVACLPFLFQGWTSATAADLGVRLLLWLALSAMTLIVIAQLRAQRLALQVETAHAQELALQDSLTGLGNRRRLMADLDQRLQSATQERPLVLAMFDLDGFKAYNDTYGHNTGDELLKRLGDKLAASMAGRGVSYRMGGDEFCVLAGVQPHDAPEIVDCAARALSDRGDGFRITASCGWVLLPDALAPDPSTALRIADRRMYAQKNLARASAGRQTVDVLLKVLSERSVELGNHLHDVTGLCRAVGERLGLAPEEIGPLLQAASLHDIGKAAIPDSILDKPAPLNQTEWAFMRTHTVIGERILAAAPALTEAARLVRSSHERWDGGGYPDRLVAEAIPLGARIIAVCDAYDAMVSNRPYRSRMSTEVALEELRRCAGVQFDPAVVEAFCTLVAERAPAER